MINWLKNQLVRLIKFGDHFAPQVNALVYVAIRLWIAIIFWKSGLTKIDDWESTILLFENEYKVPLLNPVLAAHMGTTLELAAPILLLTGFGARLAALSLLVMTAIIQFTYQSNINHLVWALFLGVILINGPGRYSWDFFIRGKMMGDAEKLGPGSVLLSVIAVASLTFIAAHEILIINNETNSWLNKWDMFWYGHNENSA